MFVGATSSDVGGITGFIFSVIERFGGWGLALLNVMDTFFPPIPSEVFLPVGGYLASQDELDPVLAWTGATAGSLVGALLLYAVGRRLGRDRVDRILSKLPLVSGEELDDAQDWFRRHGTASVLFGRLIPGVRSLVSFPAGTTEMPIGRFSVLTVLGSGTWNAALIAGGWALGERWGRVEQYSSWIDMVLVVGGILLVARFVWKRRRRIGGDDGTDTGRRVTPAEPGDATGRGPHARRADSTR